MGRQGNTDTLNLDAVGVQADKRGLLEVNSFYQVRFCSVANDFNNNNNNYSWPNE